MLQNLLSKSNRNFARHRLHNLRNNCFNFQVSNCNLEISLIILCQRLRKKVKENFYNYHLSFWKLNLLSLYETTPEPEMPFETTQGQDIFFETSPSIDDLVFETTQAPEFDFFVATTKSNSPFDLFETSPMPGK